MLSLIANATSVNCEYSVVRGGRGREVRREKEGGEEEGGRERERGKEKRERRCVSTCMYMYTMLYACAVYILTSKSSGYFSLTFFSAGRRLTCFITAM